MERIRTPGAPVELLPALLAVGVFVAWAAAEGGFAPTAWYPGALFLLGLLVITVGSDCGHVRTLSRVHRLTLGLLAGFAAWGLLSISWADVPGVAWDGANRALLYLVVFSLFSLLRLRSSARAAVLAVYSAGIAVVGAVALIDAAGSSEPELSTIGGRFIEPVGYPNAESALFFSAVWPALYFSARRGTPWPFRGLLLASAGLLAQLALLPQSRGALIVLPIATAVYLAVVPDRRRAQLAVIAVAAATAAVAAPILRVYTTFDEGGDVGAALADARNAMLLSFVALLAVGAGAGALERWRAIPARTAQLIARGVDAVLALVVLAALCAAIVVIGSPITWAGDRIDDFKGGYDGDLGSSRFGGELGSNRYDFWRVAIEDQFAAHPLTGDGADNFAVDYLRERNSDEQPLYPHSLPIRLLAGTGIVGTLLFVAFLIAAVIAVNRNRSRASPMLRRGVSAVTLASLAYWGLHSSGDWLFSFPALSAPIFAWLGIAAASEPGRAPQDAGTERTGRPLRGRSRAVLLAGGVSVVLFAACSFALPWMAARDVEIAQSIWRTDPTETDARLDRARQLNFLSAEPDLLGGAIAARLGDHGLLRERFNAALGRDPFNWYALLELGTVDALEGHREDARERFREAYRLNPRDPLVRTALRRFRRDRPLTLNEIDRALLGRVCSVVGATEQTRYCE